MPQGSPFASSSRYQMGSNYLTDVNQGGGNKKPGLPYLVGRGYMIGSIFKQNNATHSLAQWNYNVFPISRQSRPISSLSTGNYKYYHMPGVGKV